MLVLPIRHMPISTMSNPDTETIVLPANERGSADLGHVVTGESTHVTEDNPSRETFYPVHRLLVP